MCFPKLFFSSRRARSKADHTDSAASNTTESVVLNTENPQSADKMNDGETSSTDTASSKKDPPPYSSVKACILDPVLEFYAEKVRNKMKLVCHEDRDKAFAKGIVRIIADHVDKETVPAPYTGRWGYSFGGNTELSWDELVGYPAKEAFKNERVSFIVAEAKLDLERRGFVVEELELVLSDSKYKSYEDKLARDCKRNAGECYCWYHGIYVHYKLR